MNGITRETFEHMNADDKLNVLFDFLNEAYRCTCEAKENLELLHAKIEKKKKIDSMIAGGGGMVGGFIAFISGKIFGPP